MNLRQSHPIPSEVRTAVLKRAHHQCEDCFSDGSLELHHLTYERDLGVSGERGWIFGHETIADLDALCRDCHRARHVDLNGDFWADPEQMYHHWATFEKAMDCG